MAGVGHYGRPFIEGAREHRGRRDLERFNFPKSWICGQSDVRVVDLSPGTQSWKNSEGPINAFASFLYFFYPDRPFSYEFSALLVKAGKKKKRRKRRKEMIEQNRTLIQELNFKAIFLPSFLPSWMSNLHSEKSFSLYLWVV